MTPLVTLRGLGHCFGTRTVLRDVVDAIATTPTDRNDRPATPVVISSVTIAQ